MKQNWNKSSRQYKKWKRINAKNAWRFNKVSFDEAPTITTVYGSTLVDWRRGDYPLGDKWSLSSESYKEIMGLK